MPDYLTLCERAARAGGQALVSWRGRFGVREKGPKDLVTEADLASQEAVRQIVLSACPDHAFLSEEDHGAPLAGDCCWIVDPLDGTTNYVHGVPHYCVSVALAHHGRVVVGAVYDPVADDCYLAERGKGARLNGRAIHTSRVASLSQAVVAASFSAHIEFPSQEIDQFVEALLACQAVRRTGSAALNLCYVACGRLDGFWELKLKPWDTAAGALIVTEAGGKLSDFAEKNFSIWGTETLATNGLIHAAMVLVTETIPPPATSLTGP